MMIWVLCALLAGITALVVVMPVLRPRMAQSQDMDLQVYHDQMDQLTRDHERGLLGDPEAEARKAEIARRLISSRKSKDQAATATGGKPLAIIAAVGICGGAIGLYATLGAPGYRDVPLQMRLAAAAERRETRPSQAEMLAQLPQNPRTDLDASYVAMVDELRRVMKDRPDDIRGLGLLVQHEANMGNFDAAIAAQEQIIALKGAEVSTEDNVTLMDLLVYQVQGYVSPRAEEIARQILDEDPDNTGARHYIALLHDQTDRPDIAFRLWREVLETGSADDPYVDLARRFVTQAAMRAGQDYTLPDPPSGPSADDIAAAENLSDTDRQAMITGMVDGLASRLAAEGGPPQDWARLIGALSVLGETDRAATIWYEAQQVYASDPAALRLINDAAKDARLGQ